MSGSNRNHREPAPGEEQHDRACDQAHGDVEPAAHAAREALHDAVRGVGEGHAIEQFGGASARLGGGHAVEATDEDQVLAGGQTLVDGRVLARQPDARSDPARLGHHVDAVDARRAGVGA